MAPTMVSIRASNANGQSTTQTILYAGAFAGLFFTSAYLAFAGDIGDDASAVNTSTGLAAAVGGGGGGGADNQITQGSVPYSGDTLAYYHCGPLPSRDDLTVRELVLLHGAVFTKEDWKSSGILDMLCDVNHLSVSALDLPVSADGQDLGSAFDALTSGNILSGRAATFVSPSASGKALVSLGEMADVGSAELSRMIKAWIPVASGAVLSAPESSLRQYKAAKINILAIHGDQDARGSKVTNRLTDLNDAKGVELPGRHPVYLDSPKEFVREVMQFLDQQL